MNLLCGLHSDMNIHPESYSMINSLRYLNRSLGEHWEWFRDKGKTILKLVDVETALTPRRKSNTCNYVLR